MKRKDAKPWQTDSRNLKTPKVQYWTQTGTMLGLTSLENAREHVDEGFAFVVCDQAIQSFEDRAAVYCD